LAVSLKIVYRKGCYIRLCTEINLRLLSRPKGPHPGITLRIQSTKYEAILTLPTKHQEADDFPADPYLQGMKGHPFIS